MFKKSLWKKKENKEKLWNQTRIELDLKKKKKTGNRAFNHGF